jgi:hypothetical protein
MAAIKPIEQSSDKWVRRASVAGADYLTGVQNPRKPWAAGAAEGEGNYKAGVVAAANAGRFGVGVRAAGDEKWRNGALKKGPGRFAEGVAIGKDDWGKGFAPYQSAIAALALPNRGPKGSAQNIQRVSTLCTALRTLKEKGGK